MLKQFLALALFIIILFCAVLVHYNTYEYNTQKDHMLAVNKFTKLSSISLSVAYNEPRVLFYDESNNPAYPQMQDMNKMDFIYAK